MKTQIKQLALLTATALFSAQSFATAFTEVRIGDIDGFGFNVLSPSDFTSVIGGNDNNSDGKLGVADQLPSLGGGSGVLTGDGDDFDNRITEGYSITGGVIGSNMSGVGYTDISLSTSYATSSAASAVYNANTNTDGSGGTFPEASTAVPNQPGFVFDFSVAGTDISPSNDIFFNMLFGDYDVTPASIVFTYADNSTQILSVATQAGVDGLIQAAFVTLAFNDVFTANGSDWNGYLEVDFDAPNEPYTAFDFVELSTTAIETTVSAPATVFLALGLLGAGFARKRRTH